MERNARMKRSSYGELNYAFGQAMLTLRTTIGLTQAGVAERLGVSRKAVGEWEAGLNYPQAAHLKAFIALAVVKQAFHLAAHGNWFPCHIWWVSHVTTMTERNEGM